MYITAHRVSIAGKTGINTFLFSHGQEARNELDLAYVRTDPGRLLLQRAEIPPGGKTVLSLLDVVAQDSLGLAQLAGYTERIRYVSGRASWQEGGVSFSFQTTRPDPAREFEVLRSHVLNILRTHATGELPEGTLIVHVLNDDVGVSYVLDKASASLLRQRHPDLQPARVSVPFENHRALIHMWGEPGYRAEIAQAITGLTVDELSHEGGVTFRDRDGLLRTVASRALTHRLSEQLDGFWYSPSEAIPDEVPVYTPSGALLLNHDRTLALVLVPVEYYWFPISEAAVYTYRHTAGLWTGEQWTFRATTGAKLQVSRAPSLTLDKVEATFGAEPALRCRSEYPTVCVAVKPWTTSRSSSA